MINEFDVVVVISATDSRVVVFVVVVTSRQKRHRLNHGLSHTRCEVEERQSNKDAVWSYMFKQGSMPNIQGISFQYHEGQWRVTRNTVGGGEVSPWPLLRLDC